MKILQTIAGGTYSVFLNSESSIEVVAFEHDFKQSVGVL